MKKYILALIAISSLAFASCSEDDDVNCTLEFRTIGITVKGDSLTDFFTIRNSNSDTIKYAYVRDFGADNWYPILDDSYQSSMANEVDLFRFIGIVNDTIKVDEEFTIEADNCHINRLQGVNEIEI